MQRVLGFLAMFQRERRPGDLIFAIGFFVLALVAAAVLPQQARFLGATAFVAEPGFWPLVGVCMMVVFGAVHLATTWIAPPLAHRWEEVRMWGRSLEYVAWFVLYVAIVPYLGYLPSTLVFALLLTFRLGYRSAGSLAASAAFAVAVVLVFKTGLGVRLPAGAIYAYLPHGIRSFVMVNF